MKRIQKILFVAATTTLGLMLGIGSAHAQAINSGQAQGAVDLTLTGTVQSSIMLTVAATSATTLSSVTNTVTPSTASVNFGTFNTQAGFTGVPNGRFVRASSGTAGALLVAELTAMATYTGNGGPIGAANVNVTLGAGTNMTGLDTRVQQGSPATWTAGTSGTQVSATPFSLCPNANAVTGNCVSGTAYAHELAVFVPDTIAGGTTFSQVVHYIATLD